VAHWQEFRDSEHWQAQARMLSQRGPGAAMACQWINLKRYIWHGTIVS
jgi:hypothetical protein